MAKENRGGENTKQPLKPMVAKYSQHYRKILMLCKVIKAGHKSQIHHMGSTT